MNEVVTTTSGLLDFIQRAAKDPSFDVHKFEILLNRHEAMLKEHQRGLYTTAYSAMQNQIGQIIKSGRNPTFQNPYATLEDLDAEARPVYSEHGFSIQYGAQDHPKDGWMYITITVMHSGGYATTTRLPAPIDLSSRARTPIQAIGSTVTYMRRYLLQMALNLVPKNNPTDDDGEGTRPPPPLDAEQLVGLIQACTNAEQLVEFRSAYRNDFDQLGRLDKLKISGALKAKEAELATSTKTDQVS